MKKQNTRFFSGGIKALLSGMLVVLMLAGISTFAFAAPSPTQDTGDGYWTGDAPKADPKAAAKADAAKAESTAVKAITDAAAEEGTVALGKLPGNADAAMKADFEKLIDTVKNQGLKLDGVVTNIYPFEKAAQAFEDFHQNAGSMLKVMIEF